MTSLSEDCAKSARFLIRKAQIAARQRKWRDRCYSIAVIGGLFLFAAWFVSPGSSGAELPPALLPKKRRSEYGVDGSEQLASDPLARAAQLAELEEKSSRTLRKGNVGGGGGVGLGATVRRSRTILLGSEDGKINTGVWPGWGNGERSVLNWAAAGVEVNKYCPYQCTISHDQSLYTSADAIVLVSAMPMPMPMPLAPLSASPPFRTDTLVIPHCFHHRDCYAGEREPPQVWPVSPAL